MSALGSGNGRWQIEEFMHAVDPDDVLPGRFEHVSDSTGRKWRCTLCGRTGYMHTPREAPRYGGRHEPVRWLNWRKWQSSGLGRWAIGCCFPHDWPCSCGLSFRSYGNLWRHIGGPRPTGWGRQGEHQAVTVCTWPQGALS